MKNSRRQFIQTASLAIAGLSMKSNGLWANGLGPAPSNYLLGIQLYSVRSEMKANPIDTLKQLSSMGYTQVEHANYIDRKFYGYSPIEFKKVLDDLGLHMPSGHTELKKSHWDTSTNQFTDEWKYTVEDAATLGQSFVISPGMDRTMRKTYDGLLKFSEYFNRSGELCTTYGMKFGYHNHDFEFSEKVNGEMLFDVIVKNTDPSHVIMQLDTGNMYGVGGRAKEWIEKYPTRFASIHVKDEIKVAKGEMDSKYESTLLGKGLIDTKEICTLLNKMGGMHHFIIEQESYQNLTPLESAKINLDTMKSWHL